MKLSAAESAAITLCLVSAAIGSRCSGEGTHVKGSDNLWEFVVRREGKEFHVLSLLSPDDAFTGGIPLSAQVGQVRRRAREQDGISPEDFQPNPVFVNLLHDTIATFGPNLGYLQTQAKAIGDGLVYVVDERSPKSRGEVPTEDIFGSFDVTEGRLVVGSYNRNDSYQLLTRDGFFHLQEDLRRRLLEQVKNARN